MENNYWRHCQIELKKSSMVNTIPDFSFEFNNMTMIRDLVPFGASHLKRQGITPV
jgi:hypothetical protein